MTVKAATPERVERPLRVNCPHCGHWDTKVIDSRGDGQSVWRRRQCMAEGCNQRFSTREKLDLTLNHN